MREILFRGKRQYNGAWVEGCLYRDLYGNYKIREHKVYDDDVYMDDYNIIPESISEFTGLTDQNGKKVFEGDIVEYEHELSGFLRFELGEDYKPRRSHSCHWDDKHYLHYKRNYAVEWKEKDARWILRNGSDQHDLRRTSLSMHNGVIISNIHDNPELLKGGER